MVYILLHKSVQHDNLGYVKYKRHEFDNEIEIVAKALMITSGHNTGHISSSQGSAIDRTGYYFVLVLTTSAKFVTLKRGCLQACC